ncbi:MAG TPA: hypothetical protein VK616_10985 [Flavitalea sp.]|nr:hypothetical protein [Flavitalea sp.]
MSVNLIESVQKNLGLPPLHKIDPNTNEIAYPENTPRADRLSQAAIPAVLTAFYKITRTPGGSDLVLRGNFSTSWINTLFGEEAPRAVGAISDYAGTDYDQARNLLESVAVESARLISANTKDAAAATTLLTDQRSNILSYLPAALQIGDLLNDSTLDDRTNKMKGPISNMMHSIEQKFSESDQSTPSQT